MSRELGEFIKNRLRISGQRQEDLARNSYVAAPTVTRWIQGATPKYGHCICIAMFFDTPVDHIIALTGDQTYQAIWQKARIAYAPYDDDVPVQRLTEESKHCYRRFAELLEAGGTDAVVLKNVVDTYWRNRRSCSN